MPDPILLPLSGAVLPDNDPIARRHVRRPERRSPEYLERYDRKTLFYDCVYREDRGGYLFTAPRFLNLWREFRDRLRIDGDSAAELRRYRHDKYEQVFLPGPHAVLSLDWPGGWLILPRPDISESFAGLNAVMTMNRDNDLEWITDWLRYHVEVHGLEAALVFDNGSTRYRPSALAEAMGQVPGLKVACVLVAPYPYGPPDSGKGHEIRPKFLQPAMLNLARTDVLRKARAVLNIDIDEIVLRRRGPSIFDRAAASLSGATRIRGHWAFPPEGTDGPVPHGVHVFRGPPDWPTTGKWCACPGRGLSRFGWFVHHVGGDLYRLLKPQTDCDLAHCRATSTGWKLARYTMPPGLTRDPELETLMAEHFPVRDTA